MLCSYSAIAAAKAGNALPQMQRLNLGKFRGPRAGELDKVLQSKRDRSSIDLCLIMG